MRHHSETPKKRTLNPKGYPVHEPHMMNYGKRLQDLSQRQDARLQMETPEVRHSMLQLETPKKRQERPCYQGCTEAQVVPMKLKRKLCYKGHYIFQYVQPRLL